MKKALVVAMVVMFGALTQGCLDGLIDDSGDLHGQAEPPTNTTTPPCVPMPPTVVLAPG